MFISLPGVKKQQKSVIHPRFRLTVAHHLPSLRAPSPHKPIFTPHVDTGDHVVIINAERVLLSGNKETQKIYTHYTGYVGNQKVETPKSIRRRKPELIVEKAVRGMIPHNKLGNAIYKKLNVYVGSEHPHEAQNPEVFEIK